MSGRRTRKRFNLLLSCLLCVACVRQKAPARNTDALEAAGLQRGATVLWIGAHPDDEAIVAGALLAELSRGGRRVFVVSLTRGEGTGIRGAEVDESVAAVRAREYCLTCSLYLAGDCVSENFPSRAHLKNSGDGFEESPEEVIEIWKRLGPADPIRLIEEWIRRVRPNWIITLDPDHGMYGHPEHRAAGKLAIEAARRVQSGISVRIFAAENRFASLSTNLDPGPVSVRLPSNHPCGAFRSCWEAGAEAVATYSSQALPDLRGVPAAERFTFLRELSLR